MKKFFIIAMFAAAACGRSDGDFDASGSFEATEVIVSSQIGGLLLNLDVSEGQQVAAGEIVGGVDTVQLVLRIRQLRESIAALDSRRTDIAKQVAVTEQQIATQKNERARFEKLVEADAANRKQLDDINSSIALLEKQLAAQRSTMESGNRSLTQEAGALEVQIEQAEDQLARSRISSPVTGTVLVKYAEAGEMAAAGRPLFRVANLEEMFLRAYVTADQLTRIRLGDGARVFADFGKDGYREYEGRIAWISDRSEFTPKNIQTRDERADMVYALKVAVKNDGYIKIGMYGQLKFTENEK